MKVKSNIFKFVVSQVIPLIALLGMLVPVTANAALVNGEAHISFDNAAFSAASGFSVTRFYDATYNSSKIGTLDAAAGTDVVTNLVLPVNSNTSTITYSAADRTVQATTIDTSNTSTGQIGLSGAFKIDHPLLGGLQPYDFDLEKINGVWNVVTYSSGFGHNTFLQLTNVSETFNGLGQLLLSGDLIFGNGTNAHASPFGTWGQFIEGFGQPVNANTVVGTLNLAPVPVPAAVWLFGTGVLGLLGFTRKSKSAV